MTDVLEFAPDRLTGTHRDVRVAAFERLHSGLFVDAHDVLVGGCLVVDPQHVIAFGAKLVVLRGEVHLLPMRLQISVAQDARYRAVAYLNPLSSDVIGQDRSRPVRDRNRYIARGPTRLGFDARRIGVREREGGRPERGASAKRLSGSSHPENRAFHSHAVRGCTPRAFATAYGLTPRP